MNLGILLVLVCNIIEERVLHIVKYFLLKYIVKKNQFEDDASF